MRISLTILLLVIASALTACGGDSGYTPTDRTTTNSTTTSSNAPAYGKGSTKSSNRTNASTGAHGQAAVGNPDQGRGSRYPGVYVEAARVCAIGPPEKVAENLGISSTEPRDVARALAKGYLPKFRKAAFQGCRSALK